MKSVFIIVALVGLVATRFSAPRVGRWVRLVGAAAAVVALAVLAFGWQLAVPLGAAGLFVGAITIVRRRMDAVPGSQRPGQQDRD